MKEAERDQDKEAIFVSVVHRQHTHHHGPYKHPARHTTGRTLVTRLQVCVLLDQCAHFWRGPRALFSFLNVSLPQASLQFSEADSSALSVCVMETDESRGRAEQPLHFGSLAEVQQSPSDPPPELGGALGGWQGSEGFPFRFCFLQKESAGDQIRKNYDTPCSLVTCNRQIKNLLTHFSLFTFFFLLFPQASTQ